MEEKRLLERVRNWGNMSVVNARPDYGSMIQSVIQHLQRLLNSKEGTTLMDKNFGMPDFTDLAVLFPNSVRSFERSISDTISKYEPRLSSVKVDFVVQNELSLTLVFQIKAVLKIDDDEIDIYLESSIDNDGRMKIKG